LAGVVIFLAWLWLSNVALLLGAEVNAEFEHARAMADGLPEDVRPFAELRDTRKLDEGERRAVEKAQGPVASEGRRATPSGFSPPVL
jgi:membrane protein